jgi:hypothetical protein
MRECTIIVATVVLFLVHRDFYVLFKHWEQNPCNNVSVAHFLTFRLQEHIVYEGQGRPVREFACVTATSGSNTSVVENVILIAESQVVSWIKICGYSCIGGFVQIW